MSTEELTAKIDELFALVHKQNEVIANTGRQLMDMQIKDVKSKMGSMDLKPQTIDTEDFATNEDIVQLVGELQGQLDSLEDRTIKRVFNSHLDNKSPGTARIAPLCNKYGEPAPPEFPEIVEELKNISPATLVQLAEYYELIEENQPIAELEQILQSETLSKEDAEKLLAPTKALGTIEEKVKLFSQEDMDMLFDDFARYIGVQIRRGSGW